ncbi:MAG TPA: hypothetical protein VIU38_07275, partial [Anaerolineales bacterium]
SVESAIVPVYASLQFDVRFPYAYTTHGGETFAGLASSYDTDAAALAASNLNLDPNAPLPGGKQVTIPVPVPNAEPAAPEDGSQPVAPAGPLPGGSSDGTGAPPDGAPLDLSLQPGFNIVNSVLILKLPVQEIYVYVSLAGRPWVRIPDGEFNFLNAVGNTFDLKPYITPQMLAGLPSPTTFDAEVWGWGGGHLVYLGRQSGVLDASTDSLLIPLLTETKLDIVGKIRDTVSYTTEWTIPKPIPDYFQGYKLGFRWSSSVPGVTAGIWQVSSQPFTAGQNWAFPGQLNFGKVPPPKVVTTQQFTFPGLGGPKETHIQPGMFTLDFAQYLDLPETFFDLTDVVDQVNQAVQQAVQPSGGLRRMDSILPQTFYIRVLPLMGSQMGRPSNTVIVQYGPPEVPPVTDATGPLYDVQVIKWTPYRAADSSYAACMVLTQDIKSCHTEWVLDLNKLNQITNEHTKNVILANQGDLKYWLDTYGSELLPGTIYSKEVCDVTFPKGTQSCGCPGVKCSSGSGCEFSVSGVGACLTEGGSWALDQLKAAANWLSKAYADLKAFAINTIMKYTGMQALCDAAGTQDECRQAVEAAVDYGLAAMGVPPSIPNFDELMSQGQDYLIHVAVQELKDQGLPCDDNCEAAIKAGYGEIKDGMSNAGSGSGAGGGAPTQIFEPHPLALEQPAMLMVSVTRRPETAGIPDSDTAGCSLIVWNSATNSTYGQPLQGAPFSGVGKKIPPIPPGESVNIPVTLTRIPWNPPAGFSFPPQEPGVIIAGIAEVDVGQWYLLYYGSDINFDIRSNGFNTFGADGKPVYVDCMNKFKYPVHIPAQ